MTLSYAQGQYEELEKNKGAEEANGKRALETTEDGGNKRAKLAQDEDDDVEMEMEDEDDEGRFTALVGLLADDQVHQKPTAQQVGH